jgi:hypothetical protein
MCGFHPGYKQKQAALNTNPESHKTAPKTQMQHVALMQHVARMQRSGIRE